MYKIVAAVNSMIENTHLIGHVARSETGELFFSYDNKFKWSMSKNESGDYFLHYYPGKQSPEELANYSMDVWTVFDAYITYSTVEIKTKEATESFSELYRTVQSKLFNIDDILDQIIKTALND